MVCLLTVTASVVGLCAGCGRSPDKPVPFAVSHALLSVTWINGEHKQAQVRVTAQVYCKAPRSTDMNGIVFIRPVLMFAGKPLFESMTDAMNSGEVSISHGKGSLVFGTWLDMAALTRCSNRIDDLEVSFESSGWLPFRKVDCLFRQAEKTAESSFRGYASQTRRTSTLTYRKVVTRRLLFSGFWPGKRHRCMAAPDSWA